MKSCEGVPLEKLYIDKNFYEILSFYIIPNDDPVLAVKSRFASLDLRIQESKHLQ